MFSFRFQFQPLLSGHLMCMSMPLSIRRRRGGWGRGERWRDRRAGAAVQLSERGRWGEGADGAARQAAQDKLKSAHSDWDPQHTTLVTNSYNYHTHIYTHLCFKFNIMSSHPVTLCTPLVCRQMYGAERVVVWCVCKHVREWESHFANFVFSTFVRPFFFSLPSPHHLQPFPRCLCLPRLSSG